MRNKQLTNQMIAIFVIVILAFIGSALFFFFLNTDAMISAVETEASLSSSILAASLQDDDVVGLLPQTEADVDIWVVGADGQTLYDAFPTADWEAAREAMAADDEVYIRWNGGRNPFVLDRSLLLIRRLGDGRELVVQNHCTAINALQRRQFSLFVSIDLVLVLTMIVLLTNTIFGYRKQLIRLATTDELTHLANRQSFHTTFHEFIAQKTLPEFSVFLIDIDFFKQVNDTYGHAAGDLALQTLAAGIAKMVRPHGGFGGRWGGDEFIGVLPLDGEKALEAMKGLVAEMQSQRLDVGEGDFGITISAGVVPADGETDLGRLSERADVALYRSKALGRNQVNLYSPEDEASAEAMSASPASSAQAAPAAAQALKAKAAAPAEVQEAAAPVALRTRVKRYFHEKVLESTLVGVSWMAPFIAAGGILIGLAFLFDASAVNLAALPVAERANFGSITPLARMLKSIGGITFDFMLPIFTGFMAYSLAGENAFLAGFVGGYMTIGSHSGFVGAMVAGVAAGLIAGQLEQFVSRMPSFVKKTAPIVIYPLFNLLLMQALSSLVITPLSNLTGQYFTRLLDDVAASQGSLAGALSGAMMALDMGGIVNKVAYNYGVAGLAKGNTILMASVMAGGMVPPIGIALSMLMYRGKYTREERERIPGTMFMGLSFITEGALPFVFTDIGRVIPACMAGSALAGFLSWWLGCGLPAPHGGLFVLLVMEHPFQYLAALFCGSLLTAVILGLWKRTVEE